MKSFLFFNLLAGMFFFETPGYKNVAFILFGVSKKYRLYNVMFSGGCYFCKSSFLCANKVTLIQVAE